jgi:hypothetical protein
VLTTILLLLAAAALPAAAQPPEVHVPAPAGWTMVDQEYRFGRDDLWEYINGAAELFLTYRFRELVVADFEQGEAALTVSVYDMGGPLDAYGIYEVEKPDGVEVVADAGAAAVVRAPYQGLLLKDRFYVKLEAGGGDVTRDALVAALRDVAAGLPGERGLPPQLAALPAAGRVPGSVAFAGANFLGFEDLRACLYADYETDGKTYRLFVMTPPAAFLRNGRGKWSQSEQDGRLTFSREVPYRGVVVLMGDREQLVGVSGLETVAQATAVLEPLLD